MSGLSWTRDRLRAAHVIAFERVQLLLVVRYRRACIAVFALVTCASCCAIGISPGVQLPRTGDDAFQYFGPSHPFEVYRRVAPRSFRFANASGETGRAGGRDRMPIRVVFGVGADDGGDPRDPDDIGELRPVRRTNLTSRASQRWLKKFCRVMMKHKLVDDSLQEQRGLVRDPTSYGDDYLSSCQLEAFEKWTRRPCDVARGDVKCCGMREFPMAPHRFDECVKEAVNRLHRYSRTGFNRYMPGPR
ncbi:MAG: hypothetical protein AAFP26_14240 [Planctomycetota bacterium]